MDFLLYVYYIFFGIILIAPFLIFYFKFQEGSSTFGREENENLLPYFQKKANVLDSLKDLRSDFHAKKITEEEFQNTSIPFLQELDDLESVLTNLKKEGSYQTVLPLKVKEDWTCQNCKNYISIPNAKFCPNCGNSRLA